MNEVVVQCTPVVEAMKSVKYHLITCKSCKLQLESIETAGRMDG
jgi:predicted metal-binding protein